MNINFHYFVIKTIALEAGIPEKTAQQLATYSQMVDDYDIYSSFNVDDVPLYSRHLATKNKILPGWTFYPITTGFNSWGDMSRLLLEKYQKSITIPFHFITTKPLNLFSANVHREEYRTEPTRLDRESLIQSMLISARKELHELTGNMNIMRVGMLLHIFADTYAHQKFSGFRGWENHSVVEDVRNSFSSVDITKNYKSAEKLPSVGHTNVYHAPDDTFIKFNIKLRLTSEDNYNLNYGRSNTREFIIAAREIYEYLASCFFIDIMNPEQWESFTRKLILGFALQENTTSTDDINALCKKWSKLFPDYEYHYDPKMLTKSIALAEPTKNLTNLSDSDLIELILYDGDSEYVDSMLQVKDNNFFLFNVIAKEIRDCVNGFYTPINALVNEED